MAIGARKLEIITERVLQINKIIHNPIHCGLYPDICHSIELLPNSYLFPIGPRFLPALLFSHVLTLNESVPHGYPIRFRPPCPHLLSIKRQSSSSAYRIISLPSITFGIRIQIKSCHSDTQTLQHKTRHFISVYSIEDYALMRWWQEILSHQSCGEIGPIYAVSSCSSRLSFKLYFEAISTQFL